MTLFSFIASTLVAMVIHELGHLGAARMCDVPASELGIGCGRRITGFRLGTVRYTLRALPVASYVCLDGVALRARPIRQQLFIHLGGVIVNLAAAALAQGTIFGWINLLVAAVNLLPIYQHDGWKCGVVLMRVLLRRKSEPVEWTFTFSGGVVSLCLILSTFRQIF